MTKSSRSSSIIHNKNNNCLNQSLVRAKPCCRRTCYILLKNFFFLTTVSHPTEGVTQFSWFVDHDLKSSILNTDYKLVQTRHQAIYFTTNVNWGKYCFFFLWLTLERGRLTEKSTDNEDINWLVDNLRIQWKSHLFFFYRTVEHQKASLWGGGGGGRWNMRFSSQKKVWDRLWFAPSLLVRHCPNI